MALLDAVHAVIGRLAPRGWKNLMAQHGLHLDAADLAAELRRPLVQADGRSSIDRTISGFEDFSPNGTAAIELVDPARSLLYHALASPNVYPSPAGSRTDDDFPTLIELDTIENYIYSVAQRTLNGLGDVVVAVFAYQYRSGSTSVHGKHADMAYSRTGVARVGTTGMHYDPLRRSFWAGPAGGAPGVAVMAARYGAFLAQRRKLTAQDAIVHPLSGPIPGDENHFFLVPVHKLFAGSECLTGENVQLSFQEYHRSEKLRRIHQLSPAKGGVAPLPGFDINQPPFVRESHDLGVVPVVRLTEVFRQAEGDLHRWPGPDSIAYKLVDLALQSVPFVKVEVESSDLSAIVDADEDYAIPAVSKRGYRF
jgi:hypothetical protein